MKDHTHARTEANVQLNSCILYVTLNDYRELSAFRHITTSLDVSVVVEMPPRLRSSRPLLSIAGDLALYFDSLKLKKARSFVLEVIHEEETLSRERIKNSEQLVNR